MSLKDNTYEIRYRTGNNDIPNDFYIPVLSQTKVYKRAVGYFKTSALVHLTTGLFKMAELGGHIQLICSPELSEEDIRAIDTGYKSRERVIEERLLVSLREPMDLYEEERLNLVANLIATNKLDIKLAFMSDINKLSIYHEKIGVFVDDEGNRLAITGSMNDSENGISGNFESFYIFRSWGDKSEQLAVEKAEEDFDNMWNEPGKVKELEIIPFPRIVIEKLLEYKKDKVNYFTDVKQFIQAQQEDTQLFRIPNYVELREYQNRAVQAWFQQDMRGIFSMATGTGKSYTALACVVKLAKKLEENLAVLIVCPYIHLVSQWEEDVLDWCPVPIIAHSKSTTPKWKEKLQKLVGRFKRTGKPFVCITTNDTFAGEEIQRLIQRLSMDDNVLLIVDEAHNFGADYLSKALPQNIKYRIALSATINRYMDRTGTKKLFDFFGTECIVYDLECGIRDGALVPYKYYPIPVYLSEHELQKYMRLTNELKKYLIEKDGKVRISEGGKFIAFKRAGVLAGASSKIPILLDYMKNYKDKKNILVYCGKTNVIDEEIRQIDEVTVKLRMVHKMSVQRFTAEEDLKERQNIKKYFTEGIYQVITAIKCIDEGVNIPGIETAFILSSSRNPKEFIQRRGRLLRKSDGKTEAEIFDFVTLPRELENVTYDDFESDKAIVIGEIARIEEFGKLSSNPHEANHLKNNIMEAYGVFFDPKEEIDKMEEYYGE